MICLLLIRQYQGVNVNSIFKKDKIKNSAECHAGYLLVVLYACIVGVLCGAVGAAFAGSISFVTALRAQYQWLVYLLPVGGIATVAITKLTKTETVSTDRSLESARGEAETPVILVPVIFVASVITHLLGGSAGKEGAALQLGTGVAQAVSKITRTNAKNSSVLAICGMAATFTAVFGTPIGACIFALEVAIAGVINTYALVPSFVSSIIAYFVSSALGTHAEQFQISVLPEISVISVIKALAVAAIIAAASGIFCRLLHAGDKLAAKAFKNPFLRITVGGCAVIILTVIFGTDYNGGGMFVIERIFESGTVRPEAFLLKAVFTVMTVCFGFKGGKIVPSFFIGATLGAVVAPLLGLPVQFGAAIGMTAFFGGVTNCPLAAAALSAELFGAECFIFTAAAAILSKAFSGKVSLYKRQSILEKTNK